MLLFPGKPGLRINPIKITGTTIENSVFMISSVYPKLLKYSPDLNLCVPFRADITPEEARNYNQAKALGENMEFLHRA
jgi:hypothetical protein